MSDITDIRRLFNIPKKTGDAMKTSLAQLSEVEKGMESLKALGIVDKKSEQQIKDLKQLTQMILEKFPIDSGTDTK